MQKGRKKGMTDKEINDRKKKIVSAHPRLSMKEIAEKYGVSYSYVCTLINNQKITEGPEIPHPPVSTPPKMTDAELMADATRRAAMPKPAAPAQVIPVPEPALVGKMLIQIGDKMYEIGSVSLFKA